MPHLSVPPGGDPAGLIAYLPLRTDDDGVPPPTRRVSLCWRRSFTRYEAIGALRRALGDCTLAGVQWVKT